MTTPARWQIECEIMESRFPSFAPFENSALSGKICG